MKTNEKDIKVKKLSQYSRVIINLDIDKPKLKTKTKKNL